jgi:Zn-dependent peptidase ImmA (M78 family)
MIREAQFRQREVKDILIRDGVEKLEFVGSVTLDDDPTIIAKDIRKTLDISYTEQSSYSNTTQAFKGWMEKVEDSGIFIFRRRNIELLEARGFLLSDDIAPMIFVNSDDSKTGQIFTLAHELAHLWLNVSGISNLGPFSRIADQASRQIEIFCNKVAANVLLSEEKFQGEISGNYGIKDTEKLIERGCWTDNLLHKITMRVSENIIVKDFSL